MSGHGGMERTLTSNGRRCDPARHWCLAGLALWSEERKHLGKACGALAGGPRPRHNLASRVCHTTSVAYPVIRPEQFHHGERVAMSRILTGLSAAVVATAFVIVGSMTTPAHAEKLSKKEQAVVKHIKAQCKDKAAKDAKGLGFIERWRAYSDCINDAAKQNSGIDFSDID
ncbi:MAG: hypothetical protein ACLP1D_17505 [Xanthobacteraceae bacterium]